MVSRQIFPLIHKVKISPFAWKCIIEFVGRRSHCLCGAIPGRSREARRHVNVCSAHVTASSKSGDGALVSSRERETATLTRGFCVCLLVYVGMSERLRSSRGPDPFFLLSLFKKKGGICIAQSLKIPHNPKLEDYDKAIQQLLETHYSRAVIIFANEEDIR